MSKARKWGIREIEYIRSRFQDIDGVVCWKTGVNTGLKAGSRLNSGYVNIKLTVAGKIVSLQAHRVMYALYNDTVPDVLDHINRIRDDNRLENLRPSDPSRNMVNRDFTKKNKSGMPGVWRHRSGSWQVRHNSEYRGKYHTFEEACEVKARLNAETQAKL